jgi:hypothetical protein
MHETDALVLMRRNFPPTQERVVQRHPLSHELEHPPGRMRHPRAVRSVEWIAVVTGTTDTFTA